MRSRMPLGAVLFLISSVAGQACYEPSAPYCAESFGVFDDEYDFERRKREMRNYQSEVESYTTCVAEEARSQIDEAISNYNNAVESFNRRARGW